MKKVSKTKVVKKSKKVLVPRTRNANTLTESEYFGKIRSGLRKTFMYWKPMMIALKNASRPSQNLENKRLKTEYQCNDCKGWFGRKQVQIDHKIDCGSLTCYEDIVPFIQRLTIEDDKGFSCLCKDCHQIKTNQTRNEKKLQKGLEN
jgi:hypothetical protein